MRKLLCAATVASAFIAGSAAAATFSYSTDFTAPVGAEWSIVAPVNTMQPGILGRLAGVESNGAFTSATLSQTSPGASTASGNGTLTFDLLLFDTIDSTAGGFIDTFDLYINSTHLFQGRFKYGGDFTDFAAAGVTWVDTNGGAFDGQLEVRRFTVPFTAIAGANSFQFTYSNLQNLADESWGLDNVAFSAEVANPQGPGIPEPATWSLMILGFGASGAMLRRRRAIAA